MADVTNSTGNVIPQAGGGWLCAALSIASGQPAAVAAAAAGVTVRTIRRWAKRPAFKQLVEQLRAAIIDEAIGVLTANSTKASDTFVALLSDPNSFVRLAAAKAVLDYRSKLRADGELLEKVKELENLVLELTHGNQTADKQVAGDGSAPGGHASQGAEDEPVEGGADGNDP